MRDEKSLIKVRERLFEDLKPYFVLEQAVGIGGLFPNQVRIFQEEEELIGLVCIGSVDYWSDENLERGNMCVRGLLSLLEDYNGRLLYDEKDNSLVFEIRHNNLNIDSIIQSFVEDYERLCFYEWER